MGNIRYRIMMTGAAVLLLGIGTGSANDEAVTVHMSPSELWVEPHIAGEAVSLTVSCANGTYVAGEYDMDERPAFQPVDENGPLADGPCKYEVRICPSMDWAAMAAAQASDDDAMAERLAREEAEQMVTVSGGFEVLDGQIVDTAPEAEAATSVGDHGHDH